jgi:hypothetical protein
MERKRKIQIGPVTVGQPFGQLTVIFQAENDRHQKRQWLVRCICGVEKVVRQQELLRGDTLSCGCLKKERAHKLGSSNRTHGESWRSRRTPEYEAWKGMIQRCYNLNYHGYKNWGGRGIKVCQRWRDSYEVFLSDVGRKPSKDHSLDRIDNEGDYEPGNVRWVTWDVQAQNRRQGWALTKEEKRILLLHAGWKRWGKTDPERWFKIGDRSMFLESAWRKYKRESR